VTPVEKRSQNVYLLTYYSALQKFKIYDFIFESAINISLEFSFVVKEDKMQRKFLLNLTFSLRLFPSEFPHN